LVQRLVYDVDAPSLDDNGKSSPFYAVDGFPEQMHKPITDHGHFINVFDESLMNRMVARRTPWHRSPGEALGVRRMAGHAECSRIHTVEQV
jgi:hypothetical protein